MSKVHPRNDRKYKQVKITEEQIEKAAELWDKKNWRDVCKIVFDDPNFDCRDRRSHALKKKLADRGKVKSEHELHSVSESQLVDNLTPEQKQEIIAYANEGESYTRIARYVYKDETLRPTHKKALKVRDFMRQLGIEKVDDEEADAKETYHPPKSLTRLVNLVNLSASQDLKDNNLPPEHRRNIEQLRRFLQYPLFLNKINAIKKTAKRKLFEQTFVQYVWDKPDLIAEDVNQYVSLSHEHVHESAVIKQLEILDAQMEDAENDREYGMKLIEAINATTVKLKDCKERQRKLYENLIAKRSRRLETENRENSALTQWFKQWKNKEWRDKLAKAAMRRESMLKEEVDRLDTFSSLLANVSGLGRDEV